MEVGVVYLGVGSATPMYDRGLPAIAVVYRNNVLLFDVGEGTQFRLTLAGISPLKIRAVFITHLHGDHFFGLPGLIQSMTLNGRVEPLIIVGPKGLQEFLEEVERVTMHRPSFEIEFVEAKDGAIVFETERYLVKSFRVKHYGGESFGYVFNEKERPGKVKLDVLKRLGLQPGPYLARIKHGETVVVKGIVLRPEDVLEPPKPGVKIVYTGDTRPVNSIVENSLGADLLIHDSTFLHKEFQEAIEKGHSTALEAALSALKAKVKCLALFHFSARYKDISVLENEAKRFFPCVYAAQPLMLHVIRP